MPLVCLIMIAQIERQGEGHLLRIRISQLVDNLEKGVECDTLTNTTQTLAFHGNLVLVTFPVVVYESAQDLLSH